MLPPPCPPRLTIWLRDEIPPRVVGPVIGWSIQDGMLLFTRPDRTLEAVPLDTIRAFHSAPTANEHRDDGTALMLGELRFHVVGFVSEATRTLRYPWQERTAPREGNA